MICGNISDIGKGIFLSYVSDGSLFYLDLMALILLPLT
jgi:hypothetical protein